MTENYQPVVIRELLRRRGSASQDELSKSLMLENQVLLAYWKGRLMTWPKKTLTKYKIISYDRKSQQFKLLIDLKNSNQIKELINICDEKIRTSNSPKKIREASKRFKLIEERAKGRCEACGVLARVKPLHLDHIVPKAVAEKKRGIWHGKVPDRHGKMIGVDDIENLQILCETCNTGKRDQGLWHDFRPSEQSLVDAMKGIIQTVNEITKDRSKQRSEILNQLKDCL